MEERQARDRARRPLILLGLLALAACSSNGENPPTDSPSGRIETPTQTGSPSPGGGSSPDLSTVRFQTPSGNIVCGYPSSSSSFLCAIGSGLVPEPSHDVCPVDWIGVFIQANAYAGPACAGDPGISREPAEVLAYGKTWALDGVTCLSRSTGLTCHDESGNGFTLAKEGWSLLGKRRAARAAFPELRNMVRTKAESDFPGKVAKVLSPALLAGAGCGELQEASVEAALTDGTQAVYTACYVPGAWDIIAGLRSFPISLRAGECRRCNQLLTPRKRQARVSARRLSLSPSSKGEATWQHRRTLSPWPRSMGRR